MTVTTLASVAERYANAGLSVIPVNQADHPTDPKKAITAWKKYQTQIATGEERAKMFINDAAIAIVCGSVSGNLLVIDFDQPGIYERFMRCLQEKDAGLAAKLTLHQLTPSGCDHLIVRCSGPVPGNLKLAMSEDGKAVLIETRGTGGYFLVAPSRRYEIEGDICNPPIVSGDELKILLWVAEQFDQRQAGAVPQKPHLMTTTDIPGGLPYSGEEIKQAFPPIVREQHTAITASSDHIQDIVNPDEVSDALNCLDPDCGYDDWIRYGMALYQGFAGGEVGFNTWHEWSKTGTKYKVGECARKYPTFSRAPDEKQITCNTIFKDARKAGWRWQGKKGHKNEGGGVHDREISDTSTLLDFSAEEDRPYEAATVAGVATVAVANTILTSSTARCDLDLEPENIQRLRGALEVIPPGAKMDRHTSAEIIGWGLCHAQSEIPPHVGMALSAEWDERTGGGSLEIFTISDPNYNYTQPVTTASIFAFAKEHGWTGQIPWPNPEPLITHQQADPYPLDALPGSIGAAVAEVVKFVQAPVSLTACSALAAASTAIQGLVDVRRADKLEGPTGIYTLVLADSGERKTSSDGHFSKPIAQWETEKAEEAKPQIKKYNADVAVWEANRSGLTSAISAKSKNGKTTEELALKMNVLEDSKPEEPRVPRLLYADATPEALAYSLAHKWAVGAVISSEAGIVFGSHGMGKDSAMRNMAILNCIWDGGQIKIDRRSTPSYTLRNARLTMGLAVQPETIRIFLDSSKGLARGMGFLARFLVAWPESTQGMRLFKEAPEAWPALGRFHRRVGALLDYPLTFDDAGYLSPIMLELSLKAKEAWVAFHDDVEVELNPGREMAEAKDVASKAADNAARLAALFHVFEVGIEGQISVEHMIAGAAIAGWHLYESRRFLGELAVDAVTSNAVTLDGWLIGWCKANHVHAMSKRHIQIYGPNCTRQKEKLTAAIKELVDAGRIRVTKIGKQITIEINPKLLEG